MGGKYETAIFIFFNLVVLASIIIAIVIIYKLAKNRSEKYERDKGDDSTQGDDALRMTPVLPSGLGSWNENEVNKCKSGFDDSFQGDSTYYCQGKGMIDAFNTDPSQYCPKGSLMALNKNQCSRPVVADQIKPQSNINNYLCCKKPGKCGDLPVDSSCMGTVYCRDWGPPPKDCITVPDSCVDAPQELGLPANVGYCKGSSKQNRDIIRNLQQPAKTSFTVNLNSDFFTGLLVAFIIFVIGSVIAEKMKDNKIRDTY